MFFTSQGAKNWPFLTLTRGRWHSGENNGRSAGREGGNLDEIDVFSGHLDLLGRMDISSHGGTDFATNFREQFAAVTDICSPKGTDGSAICLVVGSFKTNCASRSSQMVLSLRAILLVKAALSMTQGPE